ncbi:MAG: ATP-binding cassette domain-containing protein [Thermoplasmata archaeon]|jgi:ABC-type multidrug transport system ATPase subunit
MKIELRNLEVKYKKKIILNDINYTLEDGKHILIGPNGSGKTTLVKCILGMIDYNGKIMTNGVRSISTNLIDVYKLINSDVRDIINIYSDIFSVERENIYSMIKKFRVERILNNRINSISTGESKILGFSIAMNINADLIILDEPFEGIDTSRKSIIIKYLNEKKSNYLLITHELDLIDQLNFDGLSFIINGRIFGEFRNVDLKDIYFSKKNTDKILGYVNLGKDKYFITEGNGEIPLTSFRTIEELWGDNDAF